MMVAEPGFFAWLYFIESRNKPRQEFGVFIVNAVNILLAEIAHHTIIILIILIDLIILKIYGL